MSSEVAAEKQMAVSPEREQATIARGLAMDATTFEGIQSVFNNGTAFNLAVKMAGMLAGSTIMPEAYQGNPSNCLIAIDYAARLNVSPVMLAQNMDVVKGRPGLRGTFLAGIINACPLFERLKYEWRGTDKPGSAPSDDFGCRAYAVEVATGETLYGAWIDWRMVKGEGWSSNKKWDTIRSQMFMYRAASFWSRAYASDVTLGLYEADELHDIGGTSTVRVVGQQADVTSLAERLKQRAQGAIEHQPGSDDIDAAADRMASAVAIRARLESADSLDALNDAAADISLVEDEAARKELTTLYVAQAEALK